LGLGTGVSEADFRQAGIPFERPGARIDQLAETIRVVKAYFAGQGEHLDGASESMPAVPRFPSPVQLPRPPLLIAGTGPRLLALAARDADILAFGVPADATEADLAEKIALVRETAGDRFATLALSLNLLAVVGDQIAPGVRERVRAIHRVDLDSLLQAPVRSPLVVTGTAEAMCAQLLERRERLGVSYVTIPDDQMEAFAPVVARLAGT
ncbi:MAG TPA: LLM class flavin-dependent oxidoreductase, partial [Chloroflexota bacterium]|nr:LLM class flavin-dependent oxidoreductase [Chloroflexota bacterium]